MTEQTESAGIAAAWPTPPAPGTPKSFSPLTLATLTTGIVMVDWGTVTGAAEWLIGHPIFTHEYADVSDELKRLALEQFPDLPVEVGDSWSDCANAVLARYGETVEIRRGAGARTEGPVATYARAVGNPTA